MSLVFTNDELDSAKRPPLLAKIIDHKNKTDTRTITDYERFLRYAQSANNECQKSRMELTAGFKTEVFMKLTDEYGRNNTLQVLYNFYATKRRPIHKGPLITDHNKLKFSKLEFLCRDLSIIPKLLSRDDLKLLWRSLGDDSNDGKILKYLSFDHFKDMIVRMAILAYNKPGMKKLVITIEGFMPRKENLVDCLAYFMHLHDLDYVLNVLRKIERNTDKNGEMLDELVIDEEMNDLQDETKNDLHARNKLLSKSLSQMSLYADRYPLGKQRDSIRVVPANPYQVIREDSVHKMKTEQLLLKTMLPNSLFQKLESGDGLNDDEVQSLSSSNFGSPLNNQNYTVDDDRFDNNSRASTANSSIMSFHDTSEEATMRAFKEDYDPSLVRLLAPFCYELPKAIHTETFDTGGPFIDLGLVPEGSKIEINIKVLNNSADQVRLDATTRDFMSEDTDMVTYSSAIIPGMARAITVKFTVEPGKKEIIAFIDVFIFAARNGVSTVVSCPVFYRVDPLATKDTFPKLTKGSLPHLVTTKIGDPIVRNTHKDTKFDKKKDFDGTWRSTTNPFITTKPKEPAKLYKVRGTR